MALEKKYDETPLQVLTDKGTRARIRHLSKASGLSQAQLLRDMIDYALPGQERLYGLEPDEPFEDI